MKTIKSISVFLMILSIGTILIQCQHDDENVIPVKGPDPIERGTALVNCSDCTPLVSNGASSDFSSGGVPAEVWYFDKAHSNAMWETQYKSFGSLLTGRFNYFVLEDLNFDEANPANISFNGYVRLNSVNTGEPGRDGGCLLGTYGTDATKTSEVENIASLVTIASTGRYSTTDDGFLIDANFTFLGVTKEVTIKFYFFPETDQGTYFMCGITSEFKFNALSDFGVSSSNINDEVIVRINALLKNKKP